MIRSILLTCSLAALVQAKPAEIAKPESAPFVCEFRKKDDTFAIEARPDAPVFRIRSQSGIGSAKITRREGKWPATVTVRFEKMQMLEHFAAKIGNAAIGGSLKADKQPLYFDKNGKQQDKAEGSAFSVHVVRMEAERGIEVRIGLPLDARELDVIELDWIDAYR